MKDDLLQNLSLIFPLDDKELSPYLEFEGAWAHTGYTGTIVWNREKQELLSFYSIEQVGMMSTQ